MMKSFKRTLMRRLLHSSGVFSSEVFPTRGKRKPKVRDLLTRSWTSKHSAR